MGVQCSFAQHIDSLSSVHRLDELEVVGDVVDGEFLSATPMQVVGSADFERLGDVTVVDAVKRMAGVQVQDYGGIGGLKTVSVRGLGAKHTAVSYDGVPLSDAYSGQIDIGRYSIDNVDALSLTAGQGNDVLRSARDYASAGLLEIKSRKPLSTRTMAKLRGGAFGFCGALLSRERVFNERWSYAANVNVQQADGDYPFTLVNGALRNKQHRVGSDVKNISAEGNIFGNFANGGDMQVKIAYFDSERGLPGSVKLYNKNNSERLWDNNFFVQAVTELSFADSWRARAVVKYNYLFSRYREQNENYSMGYKEDANTQNEFYASLAARYSHNDCLSLSLASDASLSLLKNNFLVGGEPRRVNSQTVLALVYDVKNFIVTTSALLTFVADDAGTAPRSKNRQRLSPALSMSWQPFGSLPLRLRASYKDIFRLPTMADLYYQRMGNVGLKPERATQYNVGVVFASDVGRKANISFTIDGYMNRVKDKIVALPTMYIWRMQNYGRVFVKGVDVTASLACTFNRDVKLLLDASYSYSHTVDKSDARSKNYGHQIPYTPRHAANASFTLNNRWLNISYLVTFVGERYVLPQNISANRMPSYTEHTISVNRDFVLSGDARLRVQGDLVNIADKGYEVIRYYPMPGRQWRLAVSLTF